jgi:hypothetical protein
MGRIRHEDTVIAGKTPVTAAQVVEAATIGTELLKRLKPKGTKSKDSAIDEVNIRDRMWTLLVTRYRELRRVGSGNAPSRQCRFGQCLLRTISSAKNNQWPIFRNVKMHEA